LTVRGWTVFLVVLIATFLGLMSVCSLFVSGDVGQAQVQATTYTITTSITSTSTTVETQTITIISIVAVTIVTLATVVSRLVWKAYRQTSTSPFPLAPSRIGEASPERLLYEVGADAAGLGEVPADLSELPSPEEGRFLGERAGGRSLDAVRQEPDWALKEGRREVSEGGRGVSDTGPGRGGPESGREIGESGERADRVRGGAGREGGGPSDSWSKDSREAGASGERPSDSSGRGSQEVSEARGSSSSGGGLPEGGSGGSREVSPARGGGSGGTSQEAEPPGRGVPTDRPVSPEPPTKPGSEPPTVKGGEPTSKIGPQQSTPPPPVILPPAGPSEQAEDYIHPRKDEDRFVPVPPQDEEQLVPVSEDEPPPPPSPLPERSRLTGDPELDGVIPPPPQRRVFVEYDYFKCENPRCPGDRTLPFSGYAKFKDLIHPSIWRQLYNLILGRGPEVICPHCGRRQRFILPGGITREEIEESYHRPTGIPG